MLDIIVAHYNEPWATGKKFFDMLGCQRGIDFDQFRVLLVHDGTRKFPRRYFSRYPYEVKQYVIPHGGVSAARNYGLDMAKDKWVQFCDFDDMYAYAYALRGIMEHMDKDLDYLWTPFLAERERDGQIAAKEEDENVVFVHGKYFRREWLNEMGLRFPEDIHYSEDSAFCAIVNELAENGRRGRIRTAFPAYIWCTRPDSVCMNPENEVNNMMGFIDRNFYVVEEFIRRGIPHKRMVGRMFADAYCAFHRTDRKFPEHETYFVAEAQKYIADLDDAVANNDMEALMSAAKANFAKKIDENAESFTAWIQRIKYNGKE